MPTLVQKLVAEGESRQWVEGPRFRREVGAPQGVTWRDFVVLTLWDIVVCGAGR